MSAPFCSSGEAWDVEGHNLSDMFKIFVDKTNNDVVFWTVVEGQGSVETRLSPIAALDLGMTLVHAATGLNVSKVFKTYLNYIKRKGR